MRTPIPENIAAEVLFRHNRTCCICNEPGKAIQIHHIDGNPSNNSASNLAVVCFDCHNETQVSGGFGRKLSAAQVTTYRDNWVQRVAEIRRRADDLLVQRQLGVINAATSPNTSDWAPPGGLELKAYVESIPDTMKRAYELAMPDWNRGATNVVAQATYQVITVVERLWVGLSAWYPPKHFGNKDATQYFNEYAAQRFELRYALVEPGGPGTGGTTMRPSVAYGVLLDVQDVLVLTVRMMAEFAEPEHHIDLEKWKQRFAAATNSYPQ